MRQNTKQRIIYQMLKKHQGQFISVRDLMKEANCVCVGAVCANLRNHHGCVIVNKEVPAVNSLGMRVNHSSYQLISGELSEKDF